MLFKQITCVGIRKEREAGELVQYLFLVILLGCVTLRLRVLRYSTKKNTRPNQGQARSPAAIRAFFFIHGEYFYRNR